MKKYIIYIALCLLTFKAKACDACGCAATGGGLGFTSLFDQKYVGIRYMYQSYHTKDGVYNNSPYVQDHFNTVQLWGRIPVIQRLDLLVSLPYQNHTSNKISGTQSIKGIGDASVNVFYNALRRSFNDFDHVVNVGTGVKIPTGSYNKDNNGSVNPSFQLGTGSWDVNFLADYQLNYKTWGMYHGVSYQVKTENKQAYEFGNQFNYQLTIYKQLGDTLKVIPSVGVIYENYAANKQFQEVLQNTDGYAWMSRMGIDVKKNRWSLGVQWFTPFKQELLQGEVKAKNRWSIALNYNF